MTSDPLSSVIFWVTFLFLSGVIGRFLAVRLKQPGVLGELLIGVFLGNILYFMGNHLAFLLREGSAVFAIMQLIIGGKSITDAVTQTVTALPTATGLIHVLSQPNANDMLRIASTLDVFSRYGVILLLFMVGVESSLAELKHTGKESIFVACIGVIMPMALGLVVTTQLMPLLPFKTHLFLAATLCATSVGITARVLDEMHILKMRESQTILGAAMIDDVLGLMILAVVSSRVITGEVNFFWVFSIFVYAAAFFIFAFLLGPSLLRQAAKYFSFIEPWEEKLIVSFGFVMLFAWLATKVELAAIVGAFIAGVIIHDGYFRQSNTGDRRNQLSIRELLSPLEFLLAPLFFVLIGMQVKLESFCHPQVFELALALIVVGIVGKLMSGLGAQVKDNRLFIGIGMLPRGEVGLVFASVGKTLGVIPDAMFAAIILMILVTTLIAPPWLKYQYKKLEKRHA